MPSTDPVEAQPCAKCGQSVVKRGHFWVLEAEAEAKRVTFCPVDGLHEVEDDNEEDDAGLTPYQVIAEALHDAFGGKIGYCHHEASTLFPDGTTGPYKRCGQDAGPIVAALKAAGALMPDMAKEMRKTLQEAGKSHLAKNAKLDTQTRLLQKALSVLGRAHAELETLRSRGYDEVKPDELIGLASLAEKIEKAIGG